MSESEHEDEPTTGGPSDEQLPGNRGSGPDPEPEDAAEDDGTGSVSGAG